MKEKLFTKALQWVRKKGFKEIKANTEEHETPTTFSSVNQDEQIIPDITGRIRGNKSYIEIVSEKSDKQSLITKWKLLGTVASQKGGKLYLLASRGYKTFTKNIVDQYNLQNARIVSI